LTGAEAIGLVVAALLSVYLLYALFWGEEL
jgi:K+-transporting ATPase KdpF subunit